MASIAPQVPVYVSGGGVEQTLTVADIWDAFPALRSEFADYPDLVDKERAKFASDVRIAAKRNREDAAYDRIQELQ